MANTVYSNFIIENKLEDILATKVDLSNYMTVDNSLAENAGMIKKVHKYTCTGDVEDLAKGEGNTEVIESTYTEETYTVGTTQGVFKVYDEEVMADPMTLDNGVRGIADIMTNDFTRKAIAEYSNGTQTVPCDWTTTTANYFFDAVVDALAYFGEDEEGITLLINPAEKAYVRKQLGDNLKYSEGFVRTGYIGSVAGVPVVVSKAVKEGEAYLATKEAVTLFIKKGAEAEQERDADHRQTSYYLRKVALVALTNDTKVVVLKAE